MFCILLKKPWLGVFFFFFNFIVSIEISLIPETSILSKMGILKLSYISVLQHAVFDQPKLNLTTHISQDLNQSS